MACKGSAVRARLAPLKSNKYEGEFGFSQISLIFCLLFLPSIQYWYWYGDETGK